MPLNSTGWIPNRWRVSHKRAPKGTDNLHLPLLHEFPLRDAAALHWTDIEDIEFAAAVLRAGARANSIYKFVWYQLSQADESMRMMVEPQVN